ncbi:MAG TPA: tRNA 2-selenouridine(34) synthase MnmH [Caulobacteraceae bacterium]
MSIEVITSADPASLAPFDAIIDVRSPAEFAEDHVPGAINLPVLSNEQRAEVGTIYVQRSRFLARRIGAAHVARNIARHLETALADREGGFRPLVYCWRGGQRSNAMATVLSQVGWRTSLLEGGYKTYRRAVQRRLYDEEMALTLVLLDGGTGSGKTRMLGRLAHRGVQVLDLEGLAGHRGSLFGAFADAPQPSQKMFESRLLAALDALDPARPVVVEAESSKIGERMTPPALWKLMQAAPRIELNAPRAERARYLVAAYGDIVRNRAALEEAFARLPTHPGRERLEGWRKLADAGQFETLAEALIELHYDPAYARSAKKDGRPKLRTIELETLAEDGQEAAADEIAALVGGMKAS